MKHSLKWFSSCFIALLVFSCTNDEKEETADKFFPVNSFLASQVASVDSSLFSIRKYSYIDSTRTDTVYLHRDNFKNEARDFLDLPDISSPSMSKKYKEEKQYDEVLKRVMITYTPKDPSKQQIQREELVIKPGDMEDKVTSIYIHLIKNSRDSTVEKKMIWTVDESFQVVSTVQLPNQPETTSTYKVAWNENEYEKQ